jgi:two-component system chemotaxis response regulator CheY
MGSIQIIEWKCFLVQDRPRVGRFMSSATETKSCDRTILIVEDDDNIRYYIKEMLELEGYTVVAAPNGKEAIDLLRSTSNIPRLVLLDLMMPVMDGASFLNILTNDTILAAIPVYIHSTTANLSELKGARGLLRKPVSYEAILKLVESYCG